MGEKAPQTNTAGAASEGAPSEGAVVAVVAGIQVVNILDFMMVMPLGPDFAKDLAIPTNNIGLIGGAYTFAGAFAGLIGLAFLDRFARRPALMVAVLGLSLSTALAAAATDLHSLFAARVLAGLFGGPATSLAMAIVTDVVPAERRGRAMGKVMGAFAIASVLGVPFGLELAARMSWHAPFLVTGALGLVALVAARLVLPVLDGHLHAKRPKLDANRLKSLIARRPALLAFGLVATTNMSGFLFIPSIAAFVQQNLGYPRDGLGVLYLIGGGISFFTMRLAGRIVDRYGALRPIAVSVFMFSVVLTVSGIFELRVVPVMVLFPAFMVFQSARNVSQQTLTSKVPRDDERASFQSLQSTVQHALSGVAASLSSFMLVDTGDRLEGMPLLCTVSIVIAVIGVPLAGLLEKALRRSSGT